MAKSGASALQQALRSLDPGEHEVVEAAQAALAALLHADYERAFRDPFQDEIAPAAASSGLFAAEPGSEDASARRPPAHQQPPAQRPRPAEIGGDEGASDGSDGDEGQGGAL